jgi:uncharacterized FlaG/YvyC family protein
MFCGISADERHRRTPYMDVPGAASAAPTPPPQQPPAPVPVPAQAAASATPSASSVPAQASGSTATLSPVVAKLFNASEANVEVSFQVQRDEVVTVFTDKSTGKEIIQFPSKELIAFGEMLDKDAGKVLDKNV